MNNKRSRAPLLVGIILWSVIAIGIIFSMVRAYSWGWSWPGWSWSWSGWSWETSDSGNYSLVQEGSVSADNIGDIRIQMVSQDINVTFHSQNTIDYRYSAPSGAPTLNEYQSGDQFTLEAPSWNHVFSFNLGGVRHVLDLVLPESYRGHLTLKTVSGEIYLPSSVEWQSLKLQTTSGDVRATDITVSDAFSFHTTSGELRAGNILCQSYDMGSTSGDFSVTKLTGSGRVSTVSGEVRLSMLDGNGNIGTTSGDVQLTVGPSATELEIGTVSGEVRLTVSGSEPFTATCNSTSGDIETNMSFQSKEKRSATITGGTGSGAHRNFNLHTTSGDIRVEG